MSFAPHWTGEQLALMAFDIAFRSLENISHLANGVLSHTISSLSVIDSYKIWSNLITDTVQIIPKIGYRYWQYITYYVVRNFLNPWCNQSRWRNDQVQNQSRFGCIDSDEQTANLTETHLLAQIFTLLTCYLYTHFICTYARWYTIAQRPFSIVMDSRLVFHTILRWSILCHFVDPPWLHVEQWSHWNSCLIGLYFILHRVYLLHIPCPGYIPCTPTHPASCWRGMITGPTRMPTSACHLRI